MTDAEPLDLDAMTQRARAAEQVLEYGPYERVDWVARYSTDVPALIAEVRRLREVEAKVRTYAEDRAFHSRGHLNTVNSGRIASDLFAIVNSAADDRPYPCIGCGDQFVQSADETCSPACWQKIKAGVTL